MSTLELLTVIFVLASGFVCSHYCYFPRYGIVSLIGGFILGCLLAVFLYICLMRLMDKLFKLNTVYPKCKNDKCSSNDYKPVEFREDGFILICTCGRKYFLKGKSFMELSEDGTKHPYMVRKSAEKWEIDEESGEASNG